MAQSFKRVPKHLSRAPFVGDLSQIKKFSEIKQPLEVTNINLQVVLSGHTLIPFAHKGTVEIILEQR